MEGIFRNSFMPIALFVSGTIGISGLIFSLMMKNLAKSPGSGKPSKEIFISPNDRVLSRKLSPGKNVSKSSNVNGPLEISRFNSEIAASLFQTNRLESNAMAKSVPRTILSWGFFEPSIAIDTSLAS